MYTWLCGDLPNYAASDEANTWLGERAIQSTVLWELLIVTTCIVIDVYLRFFFQAIEKPHYRIVSSYFIFFSRYTPFHDFFPILNDSMRTCERDHDYCRAGRGFFFQFISSNSTGQGRRTNENSTVRGLDNAQEPELSLTYSFLLFRMCVYVYGWTLY